MAKTSESMVLRPITTIASMNFHTWVRSPRTLLMMLFVLAICFMQAGGYRVTLSFLPYELNWGESCYYILSTGVSISFTGILFLVMICELPIHTGFHNMSLIRSSRTRWMLGQILYCACMVITMVALLAVFSALFLILTANGGSGWSETQAVLDGYISEPEALTSSYIRMNFSPFTASMLACVPMLLFFFTMSLVVFFCSIMGAPILGELLYVFLLMANVIIYVEFFPWLTVPVQYATLEAVIGIRDEGWHITKMFLVYGVVDSLLIAGLLFGAKKMDLRF